MRDQLSFNCCIHCRKEVLVTRMINGSDHDLAILIICKECLKEKGLSKEFKKEHPKETAEIEGWLNDKIMICPNCNSVHKEEDFKASFNYETLIECPSCKKLVKPNNKAVISNRI